MRSRRRANPERAMSVGAHLRELRKRLVLVLLGLAVGTTAGWFLYEPVMAFLQEPLTEISGGSSQLNFQTIGAAFELQLKVAFWAGAILSSPWWIYQIGAFIGPGLKRGERFHALAFGAAGIVLFAAGAVSGVLVVPRAVTALLSFVPDDAAALLSATSFVSFFMYLVLAFGLSFLLPEVLVALNFLGILPARTMLRGWRWAVVVAFTFAAMINPLPNPVFMIGQALALVGLYLLAVGVAALREAAQRRRAARADAPAPAPASSHA
ncbi:twin-arginine translocase subunit TatC [Oceanitalea stevensii]|nr:twin-arginine translocase subunit TatC [Oceanitalea stevensii]